MLQGGAKGLCLAFPNGQCRRSTIEILLLVTDHLLFASYISSWDGKANGEKHTLHLRDRERKAVFNNHGSIGSLAPQTVLCYCRFGKVKAVQRYSIKQTGIESK